MNEKKIRLFSRLNCSIQLDNYHILLYNCKHMITAIHSPWQGSIFFCETKILSVGQTMPVIFSGVFQHEFNRNSVIGRKKKEGSLVHDTLLTCRDKERLFCVCHTPSHMCSFYCNTCSYVSHPPEVIKS